MTFTQWWKTLNTTERSGLVMLLTLAGIAMLFNIGYFFGQWLYR